MKTYFIQLTSGYWLSHIDTTKNGGVSYEFEKDHSLAVPFYDLNYCLQNSDILNAHVYESNEERLDITSNLKLLGDNKY